MYIIESYSLAVVFCIITMFCWGSWANTQKLAGSAWRFELFYWDYVIGIVILSLVFGYTLGSSGEGGRGFTEDLFQASSSSYSLAFIGGVIFNLANILIVAAIAYAGMSVAFPVGIGLALVLGVIVNYVSNQQGDPVMLFAGVALVVVAIVLDAMAYRKLASTNQKNPKVGLILALVGGFLMSFFYFFVAQSMSLDFSNPEGGKFTPYGAVFVFSIGILLSNFVFNTFLMKKPIEGPPLTAPDYFAGKLPVHLFGILGGIIWCIGMSFSIIAAEKAGPAISYGLGQGATMIAAFWGVFIWKEFKNSPKGTGNLIAGMFLFFVIGLGMIVYAGV
ncbi:GRP family sugar transporter [Aquiflexum sp. LQ15W]|uniref:GRP family sugar transporter n=1 Tax=Cyclobacteriaceae TaxID=563798 RepID=UPI001F13C78A|nr:MULTISPECIES: GRP family sugar transporter [Cyclobacteriaceae]MCH6199106.1 GRP family sugar transporter [Cognataquiflexum nitidum]MCL6261722.1 GRP family sugar transporter [Aquiflexum sp. TKW24L]